MNRERGNTMIGLMVSMFIVMLLVVGFMYGGNIFGKVESTREDGLGKTVPGAARAAAKDTVCRSNLDQARKLLLIGNMTGDEPASSLSSANVPASMQNCPIGGEGYIYTPAGQTVTCPHPGHQNY